MTQEAADDIRLIDLQPEQSDFKTDVLDGLRQPQKWISSMYFYDARGSALFDRICTLPEYYLTRTERAIMRASVHEMAQLAGPDALLVEPGSGSGEKTRLLLDALEQPVAYVPVEISPAALAASADALRSAFPGVDILPLCADFTAPLSLPQPPRTPRRTVVYFPGSTLGNFEPPEALELLRHMRAMAGENGGLLLGVDVEKDPATLERAYDDAQGVTAAFNRNVLVRINRELSGDFDVGTFDHKAVWDAERSRIEMHLVSRRAQTVRIGREGIRFEAGESIHTESSHKYRPEDVTKMAERAGFGLARRWTDAEGLFSVQYFESA